MDDFRDWIGKQEAVETDVSAELIQRTAALLDRDVDTAPGAEVPPQWYCVLFGENFRQGAMGADGHSTLGGFLPPIALPRRMLAGRTVTFDGPLHVGDRVSRTSTIHDIQYKQGSSGQLCFVTIRHAIGRAESVGAIIVEDQTVVYKQESGKPSSPRVRRLSESLSEAERARFDTCSRRLDNTVLFRYSALTYNAHRIHYDSPYATTVEHYPGLVVNGGLRQLFMWDFARQAGIPIRRSTVRNLRPAYAGEEMTLWRVQAGDGWRILESEDGETVSAIMEINQE